MLTGQEFQLLECVSIAKQHVEDSIFGEGAVVKGESPVGIRLQLLVLHGMQPAEAEFKLVAAMRPRHIIARLIAEVRVLPGVVARIPGDTEGFTCKCNSR